MTRKRLKNHHRSMQIIMLAAILALLASCASVPPPTDLLSRAQAELRSAEATEAEVYAPLELTFAEGKLQQADAAMQNQDYAVAADLAAESQAFSALARTKSELGKVREQIKQQTAENEKLRASMLQQLDTSNGDGA